MRYFNGGDPEGWGSKFNFVDSHNVLIGYDSDQSCCETASWFVAAEVRDSIYGDHLTSEEAPGDFDWLPWVIDPEFFHDAGCIEGELDAGEMVAFRLTRENGPPAYLHLYNCHNGYYGHGFTVTIGGKVTREGGL